MFSNVSSSARAMMTGAQVRAARALAGIDQRDLADRAGLSVPTIQRMEASGGVVRGNVDSMMKLIAAFERLGIELINESASSGRGVRFLSPKPPGGRRRR